jgi:hypothetical protein
MQILILSTRNLTACNPKVMYEIMHILIPLHVPEVFLSCIILHRTPYFRNWVSFGAGNRSVSCSAQNSMMINEVQKPSKLKPLIYDHESPLEYI